MSACHECADAGRIHGTPEDSQAHQSSSCLELSAGSPADEVPGCQVAKSRIADESDGCIEECGGCNAAEGGLLHFAILSWALDRVLQTE